MPEQGDFIFEHKRRARKKMVGRSTFITASLFLLAFTSAVLAQDNKEHQCQSTVHDSMETEYQCQTQLKWSLRGVDSANETILSPFVTVNDILPKELIDIFVNKVEAGVELDENGDIDCETHSDEEHCADERWMPMTLSDIQSSSFEPQDVFEQAVYEISKYDMLNVLPSSVASYVKGVSWRVLLGESGKNWQDFHYDSDEKTDYVLDDQGMPPLIYPLLSTVTYLTDNGEPTVIFEQAQLQQVSLEQLKYDKMDQLQYLLENNITRYEDAELHPCNVYVSMPKAGKHVAFDPRLFHGSSAAISKNPRSWRLAFGINFHTQQSMETILGGDATWEESEEKIIEPLDLSSLSWDGPEMVPWSQPKDTKALKEQNPLEFWTPLQISTYSLGYDYCRHKAPCGLKLYLPRNQILRDEGEEEKSGATLGYSLNSGDLVVYPILTVLAHMKIAKLFKNHQDDWEDDDDDDIRQAKEVKEEMLAQRCEIYDQDLLTMNPPLNHYECKKKKADTSSSISTNY